MNLNIKIPGMGGKVKSKVLTTFTRQLATLVDAGLPLLRGLRVLEKQERNATLKGIIGELALSIEGGSTFSEGLAQHPKVFNRLYVNMVKAGESGGFLEVILSRLVKYLQSAKEVRDFLVSVMIYPLILTAVSGASIVILVTFVIPRFAKIFSDMGQAIPLPTQVLLTLSQAVRDYWWLGAGALVLIYFSLRVYNQEEERRFRWDRSKLKWRRWETSSRRSKWPGFPGPWPPCSRAAAPSFRRYVLLLECGGGCPLASQANPTQRPKTIYDSIDGLTSHSQREVL